MLPRKSRKRKIGVLTKIKHYVKLVFTLRIIIKLDSKSEGALRNWKALIKQTSESKKRPASLLCRLKAKKMDVLSKQKCRKVARKLTSQEVRG